MVGDAHPAYYMQRKGFVGTGHARENEFVLASSKPGIIIFGA
jgi:hypothetical protein